MEYKVPKSVTHHLLSPGMAHTQKKGNEDTEKTKCAHFSTEDEVLVILHPNETLPKANSTWKSAVVVPQSQKQEVSNCEKSKVYVSRNEAQGNGLSASRVCLTTIGGDS